MLGFLGRTTVVAGLFAAGIAACSSSDTTSATTTTTTSSSSGTGGGGGQNSLSVQTTYGPVEGTLVGSTRAFLGIPYAAAPVGQLRWKPTAAHAPWTDPLMAKTKGPECPQLDALGSSYVTTSNEDCLTINVWTPQNPKTDKLQVMVWIHGGGFVLGSGGEDLYDGQTLSEATGAIVMTFNYRLGPLGYLAMSDLDAEDPKYPSSGEYGLVDQRAAIRWARANAATFGGDPATLTVFGESAGGASICHHLLSPNSKGTFARAIIESGPCEAVQSKATANAQASQLVQALGCQGAGVLSCLRGKSAKDIITALPLPKDLVFSSGAKWFPVVDGFELPDSPAKLLAAGNVESIPTIVGNNADEGSLFFFLGGTTVADDTAFQTFAEARYPGHGADIVSHYPDATYGSTQAAATAAVGDAVFVCPSRRFARAMAKTGAKTYRYDFKYVPMDTLFMGLGSFHSAELRYVFGNTSQLAPHPLTADEMKLAGVIQGYWSRFADTADPNGGSAFMWPAYSEPAEDNIVLDTAVSKESQLKKDLCDFWDSIPAPIL